MSLSQDTLGTSYNVARGHHSFGWKQTKPRASFHAPKPPCFEQLLQTVYSPLYCTRYSYKNPSHHMPQAVRVSSTIHTTTLPWFLYTQHYRYYILAYVTKGQNGKLTQRELRTCCIPRGLRHMPYKPQTPLLRFRSLFLSRRCKSNYFVRRHMPR